MFHNISNHPQSYASSIWDCRREPNSIRQFLPCYWRPLIITNIISTKYCSLISRLWHSSSFASRCYRNINTSISCRYDRLCFYCEVVSKPAPPQQRCRDACQMAERYYHHNISRLRDFTSSCGKTSYRLVNKGPPLIQEVACSLFAATAFAKSMTPTKCQLNRN